METESLDKVVDSALFIFGSVLAVLVTGLSVLFLWLAFYFPTQQMCAPESTGFLIGLLLYSLLYVFAGGLMWFGKPSKAGSVFALIAVPLLTVQIYLALKATYVGLVLQRCLASAQDLFADRVSYDAPGLVETLFGPLFLVTGVGLAVLIAVIFRRDVPPAAPRGQK